MWKYDKKYDTLFHSEIIKYNNNLNKIKPLFLKLSKLEQEFIYIVFCKYKQRYKDYFSLYLIILYWLVFLRQPIFNYISLNKKEQSIIDLLLNNFVYEKTWNYGDTIKTYLKMWRKFFYLKVLVKSTILLNKRYMKLINHKEKLYINSLWYIIPLINYYNIKWEIKNSIENAYFKVKFPTQYKEIDKAINKKLWNKNVIEDLINKINDILYYKWYSYNIYIRQKSHFSIFWKMLRNKQIKDLIWIKMLFNNIKQLKFFENELWKHFKIVQKKDYYENTKINGYNWIHINILFLFFWKEIEVEFQLRTLKDDHIINNSKKINHFQYSMYEWKYSPVFTEVNETLRILKNILW